jgi:anti-sigma factor RsiW
VSHLGSRVSALVDGRLPAAEEERLWEHVHTCHPCRDLVEREGWVKTRLASLSFDGAGAPAGLKDSLMSPSTALRPAPFATASRSRHRSLAVIGGGAAGAAVVGVLALGAAGTPQIDRRAPVSDLNRPVTTSHVDPQVRPARRTRGQAPTPGPSARPADPNRAEHAGQGRSGRHLRDGAGARGTMAP